MFLFLKMESRDVSVIMSDRQIQKTVHEFQMYDATKKLFKAVVQEKHVVLYGPSGTGKSFLVRQNHILLNEYERMFLNFDSIIDVKQFLKNAECSKPLLVEASYTAGAELVLPLDNVACISMQEKYIV